MRRSRPSHPPEFSRHISAAMEAFPALPTSAHSAFWSVRMGWAFGTRCRPMPHLRPCRGFRLRPAVSCCGRQVRDPRSRSARASTGKPCRPLGMDCHSDLRNKPRLWSARAGGEAATLTRKAVFHRRRPCGVGRGREDAVNLPGRRSCPSSWPDVARSAYDRRRTPLGAAASWRPPSPARCSSPPPFWPRRRLV